MQENNQTAKKPIRILMQTTIPATEDDWNINRFSLLRDFLASQKDENGNPLFEVTARNRENGPDGNDPVLVNLDHSNYDELWLFAVDTGDGITEKECTAITNFREQGHGIMATRDHQDLGSSICTLGGVGAAHFFHSKNQDPDSSRHQIDDNVTTDISWPNYHSGSNGDYQQIQIVEPVHPLLRKPGSTETISLFPAHPHEGAVGAPEGEKSARVIATGTSKTTGRNFNLSVVFENEKDEQNNTLGRAVAESTFHHFVDYNWDLDKGCPSFLGEKPGNGIKENPTGLDDIKTYVRNMALWLANAE